MRLNIGINGAGGEIGRNILRDNASRSETDKLPITHLAEGYLVRDQIIQLLMHDPVRGDFPVDVRSEGDDGIVIGKDVLQVVHAPDNQMVNWKDLDVWGVLECSGARVKEELAQEHITVGAASKVLVTAPTKGDRGIAQTLIPGYNEGAYDPGKHDVLTNESCTTKSAVHIAEALRAKYGLRAISLATVHAETGQEKRDLIKNEGEVEDVSTLGVTPQSTGAQGALSKLFPDTVVSAQAYRVPTADGSISDITFKLGTRTTAKNVLETLDGAVQDGIWQIVDKLRNSAELIGNSHDAVVSRESIVVIDGNLVRLSVGYDNAYAPARSALDAMLYLTYCSLTTRG